MTAGGGVTRGQLVTLQAHLLDRVQAAVLVTDFDGTVLFANPYCEQLYGLGPDELIGENARELALQPVRPELITEIAKEIFAGNNWEGEFTVTRPDGSTVEVRAIDSPVFDDAGTVSGVISLAFDVTAAVLSRDELQRVLAVAQILREVGETLASELDANQVMKTTTGAARKLAGASLAAFLVIDQEHPDRPFVVRAGSGRVRESSLGVSLPLDAPLLELALASDVPIRVDDASAGPGYVETLDAVMPALNPPLRSAVVSAVRARDGSAAGAMLLAHTEPNRFTRTEEKLLADIAAQAGIVLDIARLFRAAEDEISARRRAEEVQRFFAETSTVLSSSLDYAEIYERVGRMCVPFLADLCLVDVAEERGVRRLWAVAADPAMEPLVAELGLRYTPERFPGHPAAGVLRGEPSMVSVDMPDDILSAIGSDPQHLEIFKTLDYASHMCVPLAARGRVLGALTLVSAGSGRLFGQSDLALAEEFGRRAALAIDNARLYSERDHVARALQSSLLPPSLPSIPGTRVTARYQAAGEGNEVGGDFYHVFQVDELAWWFAIGDVSGKGPEAAAIAGLARHTLRALARQERSAGRLLTTLHETLIISESHGEFCTVCCALLQPNADGARVSFGCGGHPPPIIRRADGSMEVVAASGPLLGMPVQLDFVEQSLDLGPGDVFVLYTDGVTEAHHRNQPMFGQERLVDVIREAPADVDAVADAILDAVTAYGPSEPRDDVAVVVGQIEA
jgi:PAS domain S-box-containing protein